MQNEPKLYPAAVDAGKRHGLTQQMDNSHTYSLENMDTHTGKQYRELKYIGSKVVTILFDYYEDNQGDTWYLSHRNEDQYQTIE